MTCLQQQAEIKNVRVAISEAAALPFCLLTTSLKRLDRAFTAFFRRCREGAVQKGFPRFRGRRYFFTLDYPAAAIALLPARRLRLRAPRGVAPMILRYRGDLPPHVVMKNCKIWCANGKWWAAVSYEIVDKPVLDDGTHIAIDLGLKNLVAVVTSTQEEIIVGHRKPTRKELRRLDRLQSKRDLKKKGSRRYRYLTQRLHTERERWRDRQRDHLHKVSTALTTRTERTVIIGDLKPSEMISDIIGLNRLVHGEWRLAEFAAMLTYKCAREGKQLVRVDEAYTSQECNHCGRRRKMSLQHRVYLCEHCGWMADRDLNSARNIRDRYLRRHRQVAGDGDLCSAEVVAEKARVVVERGQKIFSSLSG